MRWLAKRTRTSIAASQKTNPRAAVPAAALLVKNTSPYPTIQVESLLHFAFVDVLHSGVEVHVKGSSRSYRGRAYDGIPRIANVDDSARFLVTIGLSRTRRGLPLRVNPGTKRLQQQYPDGIPVNDWEDVLVYVAGHEARHIWQFQARRQSKMVALSEVDADTFAIYQLNEWRRVTGREPHNLQM
jgi:hypothetical protein